MRRGAAIVAFVAALSMAGCATVPPQAPVLTGPAWNERAAMLPGKVWVASGRFSVSASAGGRLEGTGGQGIFRWQRGADVSEVEVSGPLGIGSLRLTLRESGAWLEQDGRVLEVADPESELQARFGFTLPVRRLDAWLRGLPAPWPATQPAPGSVGFAQDGWEVEFPGFDSLGRPTALRAARPGVRVRAVIDHWEEFPNAAAAQPGSTP